MFKYYGDVFKEKINIWVRENGKSTCTIMSHVEFNVGINLNS